MADCVPADVAFLYDENAVLTGSKFGKLVYGPDVTLPTNDLKKRLKTVS